MHRRIVILTMLFFLSISSQAQDKKQKAREDGTQAVKLADEGKLDEAIVILTECHKLDPETMDYMYEIGYCHYHKKDYARQQSALMK
ncbi:MAG TPA: hypothetical protein VEB40_10565 [Flavipsychrobacter sp.]|nr:hypothetical protein [Flavipsychrobacter sp.]